MHEGVWEIHKRVLGPMEMELQAVGSHHIGTWHGLWGSARVCNVLLAISPGPSGMYFGNTLPYATQKCTHRSINILSESV